jgi:hypothetical protein
MSAFDLDAIRVQKAVRAFVSMSCGAGVVMTFLCSR